MSGSVLQSGAITPGHVATWLTNGTVIDGGMAGNGIITEVGITNPGGLALAINSGTISGPYAELGFSIGTNSVATISVDAFNGAPAAGVVFEINGTTYPFPGPGNGNVVGPGTAVSGDIVTFNGPTGTIIQDSGVAVSTVVSTLGLSLASVATIAALRAVTTTTFPNNQCFVLGYYAGADGGEGPFWHNAGDTTSADNGGTIIVDASGRRWYRETGGQPVSVVWFGAKGDGTTDDTAAIQATYNVSTEVTWPQRTYAISAAISITQSNTITYGNNSEILSTSGTADHFHLASNIDRLTFYDLLLWSSVTKTAGACFLGLGIVNDSNWYNVQLGGLALYGVGAVNNLWNGYDFSLGLGRCYNDPACVTIVQNNGFTIASGAELYLDGRILFCAIGCYVGGAFGGVYFNGEFSQCGTGVYVNKSITSTTNREVFFEERAIIDSCKDYSVHVAADSLSILDATGSWFTSAGQVILGGQGVGFFIEANGGLTVYGNAKFSGCRFYNNVVTGFVNAGMSALVSACVFNNNDGGAILDTTGANGSIIDSCSFEGNTGIGAVVENGIDTYAVTNNFFVANGTNVAGDAVSWMNAAVIRGNVGYTTRITGVATITNGTATTTFAHGLPGTPVLILISSNEVTHTFAVGTVTSTTITVNADTNLSATAAIWWEASMGPNA